MSSSSTSVVASTVSGRFESLDGLRGIAALVVVLHHLLLARPDPAGQPRVGSLTWWFESTPLKLATAGAEAVLVFFVLSGMLVALPVLRKAKFDWLAYFPSRILRLGLPVLASVAFGTVLILLHPQTVGSSVSPWVGQFSFADPTPDLFVGSADLFANSNPVNNPLWTLRLEVIFSLALPIYVVAAVMLQRRWMWCVAAAVALNWVGIIYGNATFQHFPVFLLGTLIAVNVDKLSDWARATRAVRFSAIAWAGALAGGLTLLVAGWLVGPLLPTLPMVAQIASSAEIVGAVIVVGVAFLWPPAVAALTIAPTRWLGKVSFSLYLVHAPIITLVANFVGPGHWFQIVAITIPLALIAAALFYRFVEQPAHRFSKRAGARGAEKFRNLMAAQGKG